MDHRSASARYGLNVNTWTDDVDDDKETDCRCLNAAFSVFLYSFRDECESGGGDRVNEGS